MSYHHQDYCLVKKRKRTGTKAFHFIDEETKKGEFGAAAAARRKIESTRSDGDDRKYWIYWWMCPLCPCPMNAFRFNSREIQFQGWHRCANSTNTKDFLCFTFAPECLSLSAHLRSTLSVCCSYEGIAPGEREGMNERTNEKNWETHWETKRENVAPHSDENVGSR